MVNLMKYLQNLTLVRMIESLELEWEEWRQGRRVSEVHVWKSCLDNTDEEEYENLCINGNER